jgi:hypothetical protein
MQNLYDNPNVKQFVVETKNPTYPLTHIKKGKHVGVVGGTGTGKTSALANYIRLSKNEFAHIVICYREIDEPIYQALEASLGDKGQITFFNLDTIPDCIELGTKKENPDDNWLIVFDDIIADLQGNRKHMQKVANYFLTSRKLGFSCWFLSQSFYQIPKTIRLQLEYLLLLRVNSNADLRMLLRNYALGVTLDQLQEVYDMATSMPQTFLKIDIGTPNLDNKFERNFTDPFVVSKVPKRDGTESITIQPGQWWFRKSMPPKIPKGLHYF